MATRKAIAAALLAQLLTANNYLSSNKFVKSGRRLTKPEQAASPGAPGLYLVKPKERPEYTDGGKSRGVPPMREFYYLAVIYTNVGTDATAVPADIIDDLLDAIDAALENNLDDEGRQSLGGMVYDVRIEGESEFFPGDAVGTGESVIPITVVVP
jgi:hypothetical protein